MSIKDACFVQSDSPLEESPSLLAFGPVELDAHPVSNVVAITSVRIEPFLNVVTRYLFLLLMNWDNTLIPESEATSRRKPLDLQIK